MFPELFRPFDQPDAVLLLHTSEASGNMNLVPYSLDTIVIGVSYIIPSYVCLSMMSLLQYSQESICPHILVAHIFSISLET